MVNKKVLLSGIFLSLIAIFVIGSVSAGNGSLASTTAEAGQTVAMLWFNVSNLSITGDGSNGTNLTFIVVNNTGTATGLNITEVTVSNGTNYSNSSFGSSFPGSGVRIYIGNFSSNATLGVTGSNFTIYFTLNSTATWNKTFQANVTSNSSERNVSFPLVPFNSTVVTINESTDPVATAECGGDIYVGDDFPCTCDATDTAVIGSGVASATGSSTSSDGITTPEVSGVFTYTCTVLDYAGNSATDTDSYTVLTSSSVDTATATTPANPKESYSFSKITPGTAAILKNFDEEIGVKEIQIEVDNEAQSVKVVVTKYDGKPAGVSVAKTGDVYQYVQIDTTNLLDNLDKAKVQFRVNKTWTETNSVDMNDIVVSKFDESSSKWNELNTEYAGNDDTYYFYDVEVTSFSYFAISEAVVGETIEEETTQVGEEVAAVAKSPFFWVVVGVVILAIGGIVAVLVRKKKSMQSTGK